MCHVYEQAEWRRTDTEFVNLDNPVEAQIIADRYARDLDQNARFYDRRLQKVAVNECVRAAIDDGSFAILMSFGEDLAVTRNLVASVTQLLENIGNDGQADLFETGNFEPVLPLEGWLIPKNIWVQGNVWAVHHHEREFPDPDRFNPNRYIKGSPDARPFPGEKGYMTFGWGRRVCSGQGLVEQGTFITIARLLWGFKFEKTQELDIFDYSNGLNMRPNPFECWITPRSVEIRATIEREGLQALGDLSQYNGETKYRMSTFYATDKLE